MRARSNPAGALLLAVAALTLLVAFPTVQPVTGVPVPASSPSTGTGQFLALSHESGTPIASHPPEATAGPAPRFSGSFSINVHGYNGAISYDTGKREVFLQVGPTTNNIDVISDSNDQVVRSIAVGDDPQGTVYDNGTGEVFVADFGTDNVTVINDTNDSVVATIAVGLNPTGLVYDWGTHEIFVANTNSDNVSVISDTNNTVVANIPVGATPEGGAYDNRTNQVFIGNGGLYSYAVSVINDSSDKVYATAVAGNGPWDAVYDYRTHEVFVGNYWSGNVTVIADSNDSQVATIGIKGSNSDAIALDPETGEVIVASSDQGNASIISDASNRVIQTTKTGNFPNGVVYDPLTQEVFVANGNSNNVSVFYIQPRYSVEFAESGLPTSTTWSVNVSGTVAGPGAGNLSIQELNGSYGFSVIGPSGYFPHPASGTFHVNGSSITVSIIFTPTPQYIASFLEAGLPAGTVWKVTLGGATSQTNGSAIQLAERNGSYPYQIGGIPGWSTSAFSGILSINGSNLSVAVNWTRFTYFVTFSESGLPLGEAWWINTSSGLSASSSTLTLSMLAPNGSYDYSFASADKTYAALGGTFGVYGGPASQTISVHRVTYDTQFVETGLPSGTRWWVNVSAGPTSSWSSTSPDLSFPEPNGSYDYVVASTDKSVAAPAGSFSIVGAGWSQEVAFSPYSVPLSVDFTYPVPSSCGGPVNVTFTSTVTGGTPPYTYQWTFGDGTSPSTAADPTHEFSGASSGASVTLVVTDSAGHSANHSVFLEIAYPPCAVRTPITNLQDPIFWAAGVAIAVVAVVIGAIAIGRTRHRRRGDLQSLSPSIPWKAYP